MALPLRQVRLLAREAGLSEVYYSESDGVVSFLRTELEPEPEPEPEPELEREPVVRRTKDRFRINVYLATGTVATTLPGESACHGPAQRFHRRVTLGELRQLMTASTRSASPMRETTVRSFSSSHHPADEETEARGQLARLQEAAERLLREIADVQGVLESQRELRRSRAAAPQTAHSPMTQRGTRTPRRTPTTEPTQQLEARRRLEEEEEWRAAEERALAHLQVQEGQQVRQPARWRSEQQAAAVQAEAGRHARGKRLQLHLYTSDHEQVRRRFKQRPVSCLATNGAASILLHDDGSFHHTSGLPAPLLDRLHRRDPSSPPPDYAALGSEDRYYIRFADGRASWFGPPSMDVELREADGTERRVASVAFGRGFDAYFIVYADGSWCHAGAPKALEAKITATGARCDLACVSLGPSGEWFVRTKNGGCWWGGQRPEHRAAVDRVKTGVRFLDFGAEGTYVCRYS